MENNGAGAEALLALGADLGAASWRNGYTALSWAVRSAADVVSGPRCWDGRKGAWVGCEGCLGRVWRGVWVGC